MDLRRIDHGACDSTNERALEALAAGTARHGDVHTALEQTRGRGQRGRAWWSAPTGGLYLTLVWAPDAPLDPALLTMAAGLGALDCARSAGAMTARLDWPNDVLVDGAKLAGVLVEARSLRGGRTGCAVGVGLNVAQAEFPLSLTAERLVTSLALLGHGARPLDLAEPLSRALAARLEAAAHQPLEEGRAFLEAAGLLGQRVEVVQGDQRLEGDLHGLDVADGARLVLETEKGVQRLVAAHVQGVRLVPQEPRESPS